jgi:tetratricopeptide (TPR) repeat protein
MMSDYYDLGSYSRKVTTASPDAQRWFNRGLLWLYGYNHQEAVKCFQNAVEYDPACVMAYWGIAYGVGCNYNKPWVVFLPEMVVNTMLQARTAILKGYQHLDKVTPVEVTLIKTLEKRFQREGQHEEELLESWNREYASAMRDVYQAYPYDWDVAALFAEALINRTPWLLWNLETGQPADGADTIEAVAVLEHAIQQVEHANAEPHPGLLHIYIHTMEMSPYPERALRASDQLRELVPDAGHLKHMPSHIDILCGDYYSSVVANQRAIDVDMKFMERDGEMNEYSLYRAHNVHFKMYSAMLLGQYKPAMEAVEEMALLAHKDLIRVKGEMAWLTDVLEAMVSMKSHVFIRFGKWQEILDEPLPEDKNLYLNTTAMMHYARAIAFATLHRHEEADAEREAFKIAQANIPEERYFFQGNPCEDIFKVAEAMMNGEVEYHKGNHEAAFDYLRQAVYLDDHLLYGEPWAWMMPTRHALGALLLEQDRVEEAEAVYRADLGLDDSVYRPMQHPNNVWSLHGYVTCLERLGKHAEAKTMQARLNLALARTDVEITASCFCAIGHNAGHHADHHAGHGDCCH